MNLWGFTPSFLGELTGLLHEFFAEKLPQNPEKGEFYLPAAVDELIQSGKATGASADNRRALVRRHLSRG